MDDGEHQMPPHLVGVFPSVMPDNWPEVLESRAKARHLGDTSGTSDLLRGTAFLLRPLMAREKAKPDLTKVRALEWAEDKSRSHYPGPEVVRVWQGTALGKLWATAIVCDDGMVTLLSSRTASRYPDLDTAKAVAQEDFRTILLSAFEPVVEAHA